MSLISDIQDAKHFLPAGCIRASLKVFEVEHQTLGKVIPLYHAQNAKGCLTLSLHYLSSQPQPKRFSVLCNTKLRGKNGTLLVLINYSNFIKTKPKPYKKWLLLDKLSFISSCVLCWRKIQRIGVSAMTVVPVSILGLKICYVQVIHCSAFSIHSWR